MRYSAALFTFLSDKEILQKNKEDNMQFKPIRLAVGCPLFSFCLSLKLPIIKSMFTERSIYMGDNIIKFLMLEDDENLEVVSTEVKDGKRIITIRQRLYPHFCPVCSYRMHSKDTYWRTVNHPVMQDGFQLELHVGQRRWKCTNPACGQTITDEFSFVEKYKHNSKQTTLMIVDAYRDSNITTAQIANKFNVSDTYALETFSKYVDMKRRNLTEAICIDEVYVDVTRDCKYALVIQDFITGEPIDMLRSRRQDVTEPYFADLPLAEREKVKYLVSDMYKPFIGFVDKYFPNAVSVVDSFHVVKHINNSLRTYLSKLAKKLRNQDEERHRQREAAAGKELPFKTSKEYYIVKNFQWLILSNQDRINYNQPSRYNYKLGYYIDLPGIEHMLFDIDPDLKKLRSLKEKYIRFNNSYGNDPKKARPALRQLIQEYRESGYPMFKDIANTLDYHFESIINSFIVMKRFCADGTHISRLSNGPIEGMNRIVADMDRNCRGFRNFEHLRNRFLFSARKNARMLASPLPREKYANVTGKKRGSYRKKEDAADSGKEQ